MKIQASPKTIYFAKFAPTAIGGTNENFYAPINLDASLLVEGNNTLAVELHQAMNTSDAGFDLGLVGIATPAKAPPSIAISFDAFPNPTVTLTWPGSGFVLQQSDHIEGGFTDLPGATSPYLVTPALVSKFYRLKSPPP